MSKTVRRIAHTSYTHKCAYTYAYINVLNPFRNIKLNAHTCLTGSTVDIVLRDTGNTGIDRNITKRSHV